MSKIPKPLKFVIILVLSIITITSLIIFTLNLIEGVNPKKVTIKFITNTTERIDDLKVDNKTYVSVENIIPIKENYLFDGWYTDPNYQEEFVSGYLEKDIILYASWKPLYQISYKTNGLGSLVDLLGNTEQELEQQVIENQLSDSIFALPNDFHYFLKWNDGNVFQNRRIKVVKDTNLEAIFISDNSIKSDQGFNYIEDETFIKIIGCTLSDQTITIPDFINEKPVKVIGYTAFRNHNLETLILNSNLEYIEPRSFSSANYLTKIDTTNNQNFDFDNINKFLIDTVNHSLVVSLITQRLGYLEINYVEYIEPYCFVNNINITNVLLKSTIYEIGIGAFDNCKQLSKVVITDYRSDTLASKIFNENLKLTSLDIKSIINIGDNAFYNCQLLKYQDLSKLRYIGSYAFYNNGLTTLDLPNIIYIGDYAFYNCQYITKVIINNLKVINKGTFRECTGLKEINLPNSLEKIEDRAFERCISLEEISIPDSLKEIGKRAFIDCVKLSNVKMSNQIKLINTNAFYNCPSLLNITFYNKDVELIDCFTSSITITAPLGGTVQQYCLNNNITIKQQ